MTTVAESLFSSLKEYQQDYQTSLPPVETWNPGFSGDMDMRIDREGRWFHEGDEIKRPAMVNLFSKILKREGDDYFLVTPVEKWRINVDEAPFVFVALRAEEEAGVPAIVLTTNTGHDVLVSAENPFSMHYTPQGEPRPMARVYRNLPGLLNRNVFYQLTDLCREDENTGDWIFYSAGKRFTVGNGRG